MGSTFSPKMSPFHVVELCPPHIGWKMPLDSFFATHITQQIHVVATPTFLLVEIWFPNYRIKCLFKHNYPFKLKEYKLNQT